MGDLSDLPQEKFHRKILEQFNLKIFWNFHREFPWILLGTVLGHALENCLGFPSGNPLDVPLRILQGISAGIVLEVSPKISPGVTSVIPLVAAPRIRVEVPPGVPP